MGLAEAGKKTPVSAGGKSRSVGETLGSLRGCRLPGECPIYAGVWQSWRKSEKGERAKKVCMLVFTPPEF